MNTIASYKKGYWKSCCVYTVTYIVKTNYSNYEAKNYNVHVASVYNHALYIYMMGDMDLDKDNIYFLIVRCYEQLQMLPLGLNGVLQSYIAI